MTFTHALATNNYGPAKFIVDANAANGTHTTIASALTSASSGDTIFIRPGTYTENLTLKAGVNLCAYGPSITYASTVSTIPNVIINGKCTFTAAGTVGIDSIALQTNSDFALAVTGSSASVVILNKCFINCTNNTGISFTSSSASSLISIKYCGGDIGTTGIALFAHSAAGNLRFIYSVFANSASSTTNNTVSGTGGFFPNYSGLGNGTTMSSSSSLIGSHLDLTMFGNQTALTTADTASVNIQYAQITGGTSSAISIGSGTSVQLHYAFISSSNTNAIAGSGSLSFTHMGFNSSAGIQGTLTLSSTSVRNTYSISNSTLQPAFLATHSVAQNNVTGAGATQTVNFTTEVFDQNSNYDGTNTFTAPITGRYQFNASLYINDAATSTFALMQFVASNGTYLPTASTPFPLATLNQYQLTGSILVDMDAADTVIVQGAANGLGANTADFPAGSAQTFFSGFLFC